MQETQNKSNNSARRMNEADYLPGSIKQRHLEPNSLVIFTGVDSELPDGNSHKKAFFAQDTKKLYIYNKVTESWNYTTLT